MSPAHRPLLWAEVDLGALRRNLRRVRRAAAGRAHAAPPEVLAVVKADAYGHGMRRVALALSGEGVRSFGVASLEEALELRAACRSARILVLGGFHDSQAERLARAAITPSLSSFEDAERFAARLPRRMRVPYPVHVKVDTGMGRFGVWHEEAPQVFRKLARRAPRLYVEGIYTHFSSADTDDAFTLNQLDLFERAAAAALEAGLRPVYFHAANSLGIMRFGRSHLNLIRPGLVLYGLNPMGERGGRAPLGDLEPVMSLRTRIAFLKDVGKGRTLSYGATHRTAGPTRIATLPVGYSHGYRIAFSNKAFVGVRGRRCRVVGRVTMDHTLVDVGGVPGVRRWDPVTLIGRDGRTAVSAEELAGIASTIPYEIVCAVHSRIPRVYKGIK